MHAFRHILAHETHKHVCMYACFQIHPCPLHEYARTQSRRLTNDDATVHDKLHVGSARGLGTRSGDVLRDVVGRDDDLSIAHLVVGDEDKLEVVTGVGVCVDHLQTTNSPVRTMRKHC